MDNHVKIQNFPGGMTKTILNEVQELIKSRHDSLIMHEGTNDFGKDKNVSFVIIINGFQLLSIITNCSTLDVAAALEPPLNVLTNQKKIKTGKREFSGNKSSVFRSDC